MRFPTASLSPRPVRLPASIRSWAWRLIHGEYGDQALAWHAVSLDHIPDFDTLSPIDRYDAALLEVAQNAPIRLCDEECIAGSATLGAAFQSGDCQIHTVPAAYKGCLVCGGISHLTIRYDKVLKEGLASYEEDIRARLEDGKLSQGQRRYLQSLQNVIDSIRIWHKRYLAACESSRPDIAALLSQVPFSPARNFHEAVQSLWFIFAFVRLMGNWPGIGRIDWLLGDYLKQDLKAGLITRDKAREILASFFIKGCEWIQSNTPRGTGDAQHYQNIVLAGIGENGKDITNDVTYLVLDIVEELGISDFPITVRINAQTPQKLLKKIARVMRHGGGVVAVYGEDTVLRAMRKTGYPERDLWKFANDGCWEVQLPGETNFSYTPFDALQLLNQVLLPEENALPFQSAEEIYQAFLQVLTAHMHEMYSWFSTNAYEKKGDAWLPLTEVPITSAVDVFEDGCIENARPYSCLGPRYTVRSPHIGGAPDAANALYALDKAVFQDRLLTLDEMREILRDNWEHHEPLRQIIKNKYVYYGNDNDEADRWHTRLLHDYALAVEQCNQDNECPVRFIPGVSTFGRQVNWLPQRTATPFGAKKGDILAGNDSPTPGTDMTGATALILSHCKADLTLQQSGAALDVKIFPDTVKGENGLNALISLIRGFVSAGGFFMQLDAVDAQTLLDAREHPENYKTLSVRVSGWNARFVTLCREWQDMIIQRTTQGL